MRRSVSGDRSDGVVHSVRRKSSSSSAFVPTVIAFSRSKRGYVIESTLESVRRTQLYRALPHELGHLHHFREYEREDRISEYWSVPQEERGQFAHPFAKELAARLEGDRTIPFERSFDTRAWSVHEIEAGWFEA